MTNDAPVIDDHRDALHRAAFPGEHSQLELQYLFDHGYTAFHTADGDVDADGLANAVEQFALEAFEPGDPRDRDGSFVEDPAVLATITSLATVCVTDHPALADTSTDHLQLVADLRSLYAATIQDLVVDAGDDLVQELAEVIYAKDPGEQGPHLGRVCTGVVRDPEFLDEGTFVEIPMPAASPECIVRVTDARLGGTYNASDGTVEGELATRVWNNNVYVPVEDCRRKHWERLKRGFGALVDAQNASLDEDQREWIRNRADGVGERIDRFLQSGQEGRVWKGWDGDGQLVRLVASALHASDVDVDGIYPAEVFYEALQRYEPSAGWETSLCQRISSPSTLEARLVDVDSDRLEVVENGSRRLFGIRSRSGGHELVVEAIEDLFELPCLGKMDDRLQEHGPVRKDLFNFVRMVLWLPEYESASVDEVVRHLQAVFGRWPWHDPTETEYQIKYEFGNTISGETPLPMNCDNDDMQRYCIGQDECPYSIWGSVPFTDSMYEAVNDDSTTARY
jgi:hypothetical protein